MLDEDKYILIDRFFNNELSDAERITFEQLLSDDMEFKEEVKLQRAIIGGIREHGKEELKKELAAIYLAAKPDIDKQTYKPKLQSNIWGRILKWFLLTAIIGGAAATYLHYQNELPFKDLKFPAGLAPMQDTSISKKDIRIKYNTPLIHRDTVWHVIHVHGGKKGDTVNAYSAHEAQQKIEKMEKQDTSDFFQTK